MSGEKKTADLIPLIVIVSLFAFDTSAKENTGTFVQTRSFSDGEYCVYKHHESGRLFVMKLPDVGCPENRNIPAVLFGQVPPPVFTLFSAVDDIPTDPAKIDQFFESRKHILDYRFGTVDTAEYEALVSQLNRCSAFHIEVMGIPFVMTHDSNHGSNIVGKAGIKGDTSLKVYSFRCTRSENRGPGCAIYCDKNCGDKADLYVIEQIADTPYSIMYRGFMPTAEGIE